MRTFVQLQFVVLRTLSIAAPVRTAGAILRPGGSLILVSSVGSPETDRGPPVS